MCRSSPRLDPLRPVRATCLLAAVILASVLSPVDVHSHGRSVSYSAWQLDAGGAWVRARMARRDLARLPATPASMTTVGAEVASLSALISLDKRCQLRPGSAVMLGAEVGWLAAKWRLDCPAGASPVLRLGAPGRAITGHSHIARIEAATKAPAIAVLTPDRHTTEIQEPADSALEAAWQGGPMGAWHLLSGADHLVFLLLLVLAAASLGGAALSLTGFTAGHTLALGLAAFGVFAPRAAAIEALIGLSIVLLAVENAWLSGDRRGLALPGVAIIGAGLLSALTFATGQPGGFALAGVTVFAGCHFGLLRNGQRTTVAQPLIAAVFGLVHGFGFAGVLGRGELPPDHLLASLLGFNLGIEVTQLALLLMLWPLLRWLQRHAGRTNLVVIGSALALPAGVFWAVSRSLGQG